MAAPKSSSHRGWFNDLENSTLALYVGYGGASDPTKVADITTSKTKFSNSIVDPSYGDGYGMVETELSTTGAMSNHTAALAAWVNVNGTVDAGGLILAAQTNGIWVNTGDSGNISNAIAVIGMRMSAITTGNAAYLACFSINVSGDVLDGIFHVSDPVGNLGYVIDNSFSGASLGYLPFVVDGTGKKYYIRLYEAG